eukprot:TRINITY_DN13465_c0_g1_i1.p1 TRINITY_DN13465_c0_g1~~TRINITY_DN13465_c0_g1_i1.p1  ORF type:complete len:1166 (-),score=200.49 TRINITY_DN13465_c0_g1_i1:88-3585(-)
MKEKKKEAIGPLKLQALSLESLAVVTLPASKGSAGEALDWLASALPAARNAGGAKGGIAALAAGCNLGVTAVVAPESAISAVAPPAGANIDRPWAALEVTRPGGMSAGWSAAALSLLGTALSAVGVAWRSLPAADACCILLVREGDLGAAAVALARAGHAVSPAARVCPPCPPEDKAAASRNSLYVGAWSLLRREEPVGKTVQEQPAGKEDGPMRLQAPSGIYAEIRIPKDSSDVAGQASSGGLHALVDVAGGRKMSVRHQTVNFCPPQGRMLCTQVKFDREVMAELSHPKGRYRDEYIEAWTRVQTGPVAALELIAEQPSQGTPRVGCWIFCGDRFARILGLPSGQGIVGGTCCGSLAQLETCLGNASARDELRSRYEASCGRVEGPGRLRLTQEAWSSNRIGELLYDQASSLGGSISFGQGEVIHRLPNGVEQRWRVRDWGFDPFRVAAPQAALAAAASPQERATAAAPAPSQAVDSDDESSCSSSSPLDAAPPAGQAANAAAAAAVPGPAPQAAPPPPVVADPPKVEALPRVPPTAASKSRSSSTRSGKATSSASSAAKSRDRKESRSRKDRDRRRRASCSRDRGRRRRRSHGRRRRRRRERSGSKGAAPAGQGHAAPAQAPVAAPAAGPPPVPGAVSAYPYGSYPPQAAYPPSPFPHPPGKSPAAPPPGYPTAPPGVPVSPFGVPPPGWPTAPPTRPPHVFGGGGFPPATPYPLPAPSFAGPPGTFGPRGPAGHAPAAAVAMLPPAGAGPPVAQPPTMAKAPVQAVLPPSAGMAAAVGEALKAFLVTHPLDQKAQDALHRLPVDLLQKVLSEGPPVGPDTSASILARIAAVETAALANGAAGPAPSGGTVAKALASGAKTLPPKAAGVLALPAPPGLGGPPAPGTKAEHVGSAWGEPAPTQTQGVGSSWGDPVPRREEARPGSPYPPVAYGPPAMWHLGPDPRIEWFCRQYGVDAHAERVLQQQHPEAQRRILDEGPVGAGGSNPSMELMSRIHRFEAWECSHMVVAFLSRSFGVSRQAEDALRGLHVEAAKMVLSFGPLMSPDPSGELLARCREAAIRAPPRNGSSRASGSPLEASEFCKENGIDRDAQAALQSLPRDQQERVMMEGPVKGTNNPSAVLMSRIRRVKDEAGARGKRSPSRYRGRRSRSSSSSSSRSRSRR